MKKIYAKVILFFAAVTVTMVAHAEEKESPVNLTIGADVVSSYVWRGQYQTGISVQPTFAVSGYGFTLGAWGSTDFTNAPKEFDLNLFYQVAGFKVGFTDYWWSGQGHPYFKYKQSHYLEGTLGYSFGEKFPLTVTWNTMFWGDSDRDAEGDRMFSTYINLMYDWDVRWCMLTFGLGISPWKSIYSDKFNVTDVSVKAAKSIKLKGDYNLAFFVQPIFAPARNDAHLVAGLSFMY
ncbi:MAG: hypothetical protein PUB21_02735 [Bacteroidales bacterium]|nr:hypothetical protein [Bacteroidales bacterium]